jgi:D-alanyl-D-alanine carboxypeptidase
MTTLPDPAPVSPRYAKRIASILKEMGISANYGQERGFAIQPEAKKFVFAGITPEGRDHFLAPKAGKAWFQMQKAAKKEKIPVILISGFRSVDRQRRLIEDNLRKGETLDTILTRLAAPGYSEHHTGNALDLAHPDDPELTERFEKTESFGWLTRNAAQFGFRMSYPRENPHKIIFEPWHWLFYK